MQKQYTWNDSVLRCQIIHIILLIELSNLYVIT